MWLDDIAMFGNDTTHISIGMSINTSYTTTIYIYLFCYFIKFIGKFLLLVALEYIIIFSIDTPNIYTL